MNYRRALAGSSLAATIVFLGAAASFDPSPYVRPQQLVDVGHRRLNLYCTGSGSPTVVLDSGLGRDMFDWHHVQSRIARHTRVCSYDRAGMGFSDPASSPRNAGAVVSDLHALLHNAGIPPPYVLAGHSIAGLYVRLYADRYPRDVAGLVFVDPATEFQDQRMHAIAPALIAFDDRQTQGLKTCTAAAARGELRPGTRADRMCVPPPLSNLSKALNAAILQQLRRPAMWSALMSERDAFGTTSAAQVRAEQRSYGSLPLIVLTAGNSEDPDVIPPAQKIALANDWRRSHDRIAALSSRGVNFVVPGAAHFIQLDRPSYVVSAIDEVVDQARASR